MEMSCERETGQLQVRASSGEAAARRAYKGFFAAVGGLEEELTTHGYT
jgi:hypothetical protein